MAAVVVAGVVNVQQTIPVEGFPVHYSPVRYAHSPLRLGVAGVGGNVARGLAALGDEVRLATFLADDDAGRLARDTLAREGLAGPGVLRADATAQSAPAGTPPAPNSTRWPPTPRTIRGELTASVRTTARRPRPAASAPGVARRGGDLVAQHGRQQRAGQPFLVVGAAPAALAQHAVDGR